MAFDRLPLETRSLLIRHLELRDAASLLALSQEPAYRTWLPSQVYSDPDHALSALEFLIGQCQNPGHPGRGPYVLAIEQREDGALLGHVGFSPINRDVEIGFAIAQTHQGRGYATEAIVAASHWAMHTFDLDKILGMASAANVASKRTLERAGFAWQGDQAMNFQGTEQDVSVYVLSRGSASESES